MAGRKRRFERDDLVAAAREIAEETGFDSVTMRGVAQRLGVSMPALYHHVDSRDELLGLLGVELFEGFDVPDDDLPWDEWLALFARGMRRHLKQQPVLAGIPYVAAHGFLSLDLVERGIRVLTNAGFTTMDAFVIVARFSQTVFMNVHYEHMVMLEAEQGRTHLSVLRRELDENPDAAPVLRRLMETSTHVPDSWMPDYDALCDWSLTIIIAGLEDALEGRTKLPDVLGNI